MTSAPVAILLGLAALSPMEPAGAAAAAFPRPASGVRVLLAQSSGAPAPGDAGSGAPPLGAGAASPPSPSSPPTQNGAAPTAAARPAPSTTSAGPAQASKPTSATRNGAGSRPALVQPDAASQGSGGSSITYGGPQTDVQPVYGSTLRDNGAGTNGIPNYSGAPGRLGGPINGTANAYYPTLPSGNAPPGGSSGSARAIPSQGDVTSATRQPLGGRPYSRDQTGTFGGRAGYNAQGVYNGTAAQTGVGYGSGYAPSGRPVGGLLSTGVDATGPLRPYIPLDSGPIARPNSGYGVPNGSRSSHMDGRGVQRLD